MSDAPSWRRIRWAALCEPGPRLRLLSYAGGLFVGLSCDWDRVGDLHEVTAALAEAFDELRKTASH